MKVIRAPLRIGLWGGGTDQPEYYSKYRSIFINFAINKYIYVIHNERPTGGYRVSYSQVEELDSLADAKHTLVAELGRQYDLPPCTLTITSDVPKGTGLGSSSALAVCLLKLAGYASDKPVIWRELELALGAFKFERAAGSKVGRQDHLPAARGYFSEYRLDRRGSLRLFPKPLLGLIAQRMGMLFYTGITREADKLFRSWEEQVESLQAIQAVATKVSKMTDGLDHNICPEEMGAFLKESWEIKKQIPGVMTPELEEQYERIMAAGAMGAKLCGAGAGGCWFAMGQLWTRDKIRAVAKEMGLIEIPFRVDVEGVKEWEMGDGPELKV